MKTIIDLNRIKIKSRFFTCFWAAASILCIAAIFFFSSKNGEQSAEMSDFATGVLFGGIDASVGETTPFVEDINTFVRKCAHFLVFSMLGFCIANTARQFTGNKKCIFFISSGAGSLYGAIDEWHQYFVPGRSCMWQDWLLDTAGVLFGVGAAFFAVWIIRKIRR